MHSSIRWRLALSFATIALLAALLLGAILLALLLQSYSARERAYLEGNATAIGRTLTQYSAAAPSTDAARELVKGLAFLSQARVRWLDAKGATLVDTGVPERTNVAIGGTVGVALATTPDASLATAAPPDVILAVDIPLTQTAPVSQAIFLMDGPPAATGGMASAALAGPNISVVSTYDGFGLNMEAPQALERSSQVVRVALYDPSGAVTGAIELSEGPAYGRDILTSVARGWLAAGVLAVLLASLAGWLAAGRITAPIHALAQTASRMAEGDLTARVPDAGGPASSQDELGQMARAFNHMAGQMESTIVTLRQFVADAAHQLHTPLTALRTNLELAAGPEESAPQNIYLVRAQGQVARLTNLTDELLQLSRVETGIAGAPSQRFDLAALVRGLAEAQAARAEQAGLAFDLAVPAAPVWVVGQPEQLSALVDNLVDNALKFTPAGGAVTVSLAFEEVTAVFSVEDTGIGIPADDLPKLFHRFHRARNAAAIPGSGLGLAYVKAVAEHHGGSVLAENTGRGARFTVTLPAGQ
ncbi:MAG: HAMP domain-containing histidine kinase [Caldilinea sp.]|nr:HAMP domain-containing histidine kinase [Caldilinea sp.]